MMNEEQDERLCEERQYENRHGKEATKVLYCARLCEELHLSFEQIERGELSLNCLVDHLSWLTSETEHLVEILGGSVKLGTKRDRSHRDIN